jgi:hypothetical protein
VVGKAEGLRLLGSLRRTLRDTIKTCFKVRGLDIVDWIHLAQNRDQWRVLENMAINFVVPQNVRKLLSILGTVGISGWTHLHGAMQVLIQLRHSI